MRRLRQGRAAVGFTLVEMLVVMAVLGLLLGGLLVPLSSRLETARYERVEAQLATSRLALIGHAAANGNRLPCPDQGADGRSDPVGAGVCTGAAEGFLPHVTLGLQELDPWGNRLRYRVDGTLTLAGGLPDPPATPTLRVQNLGVDPGDNTDNEVLVAAGSVAAVLFSCGPNGLADNLNNGDDTLDPSARCAAPASPLNTDYIRDRPQRERSGSAGEDFDDALTWLSTQALAARLAAAGLWP